ncbi:ATP-binding protein [Streptomyces sp. JJ36]|uniref:ATP-binding protein n=1 Tax=Streptomyces sp. JJ36 TaxID=2736645 RepID=UPI001F1FA329|nr:ATP-binding protein [Streptomyces sp. JJ36]MCF6522134.1 ATP-binding protein [Streptomyces sp. JJ36]
MNQESQGTDPALTALVWRRRYPPTPRSVTLSRHHASHVLAEWNVGRADVAATELVVSELVTNVVQHGRVPGRLVELRVTYDLAKTVTLEVSDAGDWRPPPAPARNPGEMAESGRGLALVAAFADAWGVRGREVGKTVWARLVVEQAPSGPPPHSHVSPIVADT